MVDISSHNVYYASKSLTKSTSRFFKPTSYKVLLAFAEATESKSFDLEYITRLGKFVVISNASGDKGWQNK